MRTARAADGGEKGEETRVLYGYPLMEPEGFAVVVVVGGGMGQLEARARR